MSVQMPGTIPWTTRTKAIQNALRIWAKYVSPVSFKCFMIRLLQIHPGVRHASEYYTHPPDYDF